MELLARLRPSATDAQSDRRDDIKEMRYGYRIGALGFLIEDNVQSEVVEKATIFPVPNSPGWMVGLINLRGNIVPVFHLQDFLSDELKPGHDRNALVLGHGESMLGILIDGLPKVVRNCLKKTNLPLGVEKLRPYTAVTFDVDGESWTELNFHKLARDMVKEDSFLA